MAGEDFCGVCDAYLMGLFFDSQLDSRSFGEVARGQFHFAIADYAFEFLRLS
jgi:hypothetical protein